MAKPGHGIATVSNNAVYYQPAGDWNGTDVFTVCADDGVAAMERQARLQREHPDREIYFLHTDRAVADVMTRVEPMRRGLRWT